MAADVRGAQVGDDLVLLDLAAGDYQLVPGFFAQDAPVRTTEARVEALGRETAAALEDWLAAGARPPRISDPSEGVEGDDTPRARDRLDFLAVWAGLPATYLARPFARLLTPSPARRAARGGREELERRCRVFAALPPWAPFQGVCLYRTFFLRAFLARGGHAPLWVFGVRTWPFQAHCWLQDGELVLNDDPERVARFVPILVA